MRCYRKEGTNKATYWSGLMVRAGPAFVALRPSVGQSIPPATSTLPHCGSSCFDMMLCGRWSSALRDRKRCSVTSHQGGFCVSMWCLLVRRDQGAKEAMQCIRVPDIEKTELEKV